MRSHSTPQLRQRARHIRGSAHLNTAWRTAMISFFVLALAGIEQSLAGTPAAVIQQLAAALHAPPSTAADGSALVSALVLVTEALTLYLLLTITLHGLGALGGTVGRGACAVSRIVTIPALARSLQLALGGAMAVEALLTAAIPPAVPLAAHLQQAGAPVQGSTCSPRHPQASRTLALTDPAVRAGQLADSFPLLAPAVTPTPSTRYVVTPGDSLWTIAARHLDPAQRTPAQIARAWQRLWALNRATVGDHPSQIWPGMVLIIPPLPM